MILTLPEKEYIRHLSSITQIDVKTITTLFKGLQLVMILKYYSKLPENKKVESKLQSFPVMIPGLFSFNLDMTAENTSTKRLESSHLSDVQFSKDIKEIFTKILNGDEFDIRKLLVNDIGKEIKAILDLDIPEGKVSEESVI